MESRNPVGHVRAKDFHAQTYCSNGFKLYEFVALTNRKVDNAQWIFLSMKFCGDFANVTAFLHCKLGKTHQNI